MILLLGAFLQAVACAATVESPATAPQYVAARPGAPAVTVAGADALPAGDDLAGLLAHALAVHPLLQAAAAEEAASVERVRQAGSAPDPMLMWAEMVEGPRETMLSLTQTLPWPGTLAARAEAAAALAEAASSRRQATEVEVAAAVRRAWAHAAWLGENAAVLRAQRDLARGLETSVRAAYEAGHGRYGDVLQAQVERARREDQLARLHEDLIAARSRLNSALGRDAQSPLALPAALDAGEAEDIAVAPADTSAHPRLAALSRRASAARSDSEAARRAGRPALSLGVDWISMQARGMDPGGDRSEAVRAKVGLSLPIWRGKYDGAAAAAAAVGRSADAERRALQQVLDARAEVALASWRDARRRRDLYDGELLPLARQAYETVLAAYRAEGASFADVLAAQRTLLDLELSLLAARRDLVVAAADLDEARGTLPASLDLAARSGS